jgi:hypothetical protein
MKLYFYLELDLMRNAPIINSITPTIKKGLKKEFVIFDKS